jgi:protease-4
MKKKVESTPWKKIGLTVLAVVFVILLMIPFLNFEELGNIAVIPIEGVIVSGDGFGRGSVNSADLVDFLKDAEEDNSIEAVILEINSPGGSAVGSDEVSTQIKKMEKPVVALIREVGASGGYWIASATDHIVANRMSITGSIGVISSYLEFSGLMEKYGVGYERLVAGEYKDMGTPLRELKEDEKEILQAKLDRIHTFFIEEIAENREMDEADVREVATGEFYLGVEMKEMGLVDELGDLDTVEAYLEDTYQIEQFDYVYYKTEVSLFDALTGVISEGFFDIGRGIGSGFTDTNLMLR